MFGGHVQLSDFQPVDIYKALCRIASNIIAGYR